MRGVTNDRSLNMLRNILFEYKPHFSFLVEPMTVFSYQCALFFQTLNYFLCALTNNSNFVPKLCCLVRNDLAFHVINSITQYISLSLSMQGKVLNVTSVYGANSYFARRVIWFDLNNLQGPCCVLGDFNVILSVAEV